MKSDEEIRRDVEAELRWDPDIDAKDIGVAVADGVVTLAGFVRSYSQKLEAERVAKRISGVRAVANDLEVRLPDLDARPDPDIAREAVQQIRSMLPYSGEKITAVVKNGWVTLEGEVEWNYQRERAEEAVRRVRGVKGVSNLVNLQAKVATAVVKSQIEEALKRSAETDARNITVEVEGDKVTLRGQVRSWAERQEAERAAWRSPGVRQVENLIAIKV
jgi:osmotically-inducible protein OsmY